MATSVRGCSACGSRLRLVSGRSVEHAHEDHGAEDHEHDEARPPAEGQGEIAAQHRPQHRCYRHGGRQVGQHPRRLLRPVDVAHDGPPEHRPRARPGPLQEAEQDQLLDRARERAGDAGQEVEGRAREQDRPPAEPVRSRPVAELGQGEAEEEQGQGELHGRRIGLEHLDQRRQRREVEVGRDRLEGDEGRQQRNEAAALRLAQRRPWSGLPAQRGCTGSAPPQPQPGRGSRAPPARPAGPGPSPSGPGRRSRPSRTSPDAHPRAASGRRPPRRRRSARPRLASARLARTSPARTGTSSSLAAPPAGSL